MNVDPEDLIALARWTRYGEEPEEQVRRRLLRHDGISPVLVGFSGNVEISVPSVLDPELRSQVEDIPARDDWSRKEFSNLDGSVDWVDPSQVERRYLQLLHDVKAGETYLVVVTGTVPNGDGRGFTMSEVWDKSPLPYGLDLTG